MSNVILTEEKQESFTPAQLAILKAELDNQLKEIEQHTDEWWQTALAFLNGLSKK